jgi:precorrin-6B methylase 2
MTENFEQRESVRRGYAAVAEREASCCAPQTSCCGEEAPAAADALAANIGYDLEELQALPEGANMGLSCGNPTALAALKPGEVVLDLGSGGGFDVFIAGRKVGETGRAIGVDMTPEMLAKARRNTASYRERTGLDNVEFRLGEIEHLPVADDSVDAIISNCVINLSTQKEQVWREIARVLKPGGRVAVSDIALTQELPTAVLDKVEAYVGCVSGAVTVATTEAMAKAAGLEVVGLDQNGDHVDAMTESIEDNIFRAVVESLPEGTKASDYLVSLGVRAIKPAATACCG